MEFVKAMKIKNRICEASKRQNQNKICYCADCPLSSGSNGAGVSCGELIHEKPELAKSILEQWDKEHPLPTRADKLHELCPNLKLNTDGLPEMCPTEFDCNLKCKAELSDCEYSKTICNKCRRDFWTAEYEPPEKE